MTRLTALWCLLLLLVGCTSAVDTSNPFGSGGGGVDAPAAGGGTSTGPGLSSSSSGPADCQPGGAGCWCFEGNCFEGLECNDGVCSPPIPPAPDPMPKPQPGENDWCGAQADCAGTFVCMNLPSGQNACRSPAEVRWDIEIVSQYINCTDGKGSCEIVFYTYRWEGDSETWVQGTFEAMSYLYPDTWLAVLVYDLDMLEGDLITTFQFQAGGGVEAWKRDETYRVFDNVGLMSLDLQFIPLFGD